MRRGRGRRRPAACLRCEERRPRARSEPRGSCGAALPPARAGWPRREPRRGAPRAGHARAPRARSAPRRSCRPPRRGGLRASPPARRRRCRTACAGASPPRCGGREGRTGARRTPSPTPNGRRRPASSSSLELPDSASSSTSPASRRSVSRTTRRRISSSATTVTACWRIRRSKSARPPESRTATSQACGPSRFPAATGRASPRPDTLGCSGANITGLPALRRSRISSPISRSTVLRKLAAELADRHRVPVLVEHGDRAADRRCEGACDLLEAALLEDELLEPLVERDAALERLVLVVDEPAERLLGDRDERHLVRNLEQREVEPPRLREQRPGSCACSKPVPKPRPARW